ncbi:MAG: DUF4232 domain-containing protein [Solirubrobacteraceae bacterium]
MKAALVLLVAPALALAACGSATSTTTTVVQSTAAGGSTSAATPSSGASSTSPSGPAGSGATTTSGMITTTSGMTTTTSGITTTTSAPTTASTSETTSSPATSSTAAGSAPAICRAADLALSFIGQQGATGHGEVAFALRNTRARSCHTIGYPGVLFLDRAGAPLPTIPTHTTQDFFGVAPRRPLQVASGATVSFRLGVTHGIASSAGCTTAYGLQVIPPNDTATLRVAIPNGAYECRGVTVSPLQPGNSAYP